MYIKECGNKYVMKCVECCEGEEVDLKTHLRPEYQLATSQYDQVRLPDSQWFLRMVQRAFSHTYPSYSGVVMSLSVSCDHSQWYRHLINLTHSPRDAFDLKYCRGV